MRVAAAAVHFRAPHEPGVIGVEGDIVFGNRLPKAGPAGAGIKLRFGIEQWLTTADTLIHAIFLRVPVRSREGPLGSFLPRDLNLLRRQLLTPFLVRLLNVFGHGYTLSLHRHIRPPATPNEGEHQPQHDRRKQSPNSAHAQLYTA